MNEQEIAKRLEKAEAWISENDKDKADVTELAYKLGKLIRRLDSSIKNLGRSTTGLLLPLTGFLSPGLTSVAANVNTAIMAVMGARRAPNNMAVRCMVAQSNEDSAVRLRHCHISRPARTARSTNQIRLLPVVNDSPVLVGCLM